MAIQFDNSNTGTVTLKPPASGSVALVLPSADGTSGQVLSTDGSGNLSFTTAGGGSLTDFSVGVNGAPESDGGLLYDNINGVFTYIPPTAIGINAATSSQGILADSAIQPNDNVSTLVNDAGYTTNTGTVNSVSASTPTGLLVSGSPITTSGTLGITFDADYAIPKLLGGITTIAVVASLPGTPDSNTLYIVT